MKILGLNSPEIFLITLIIFTILGPKRIEKGWLLFQRLLKFLLSKDDISVKDKSDLNIGLNDDLEKSKEVAGLKEPEEKEIVLEEELKEEQEKPKEVASLKEPEEKEVVLEEELKEEQEKPKEVTGLKEPEEKEVVLEKKLNKEKPKRK